VRRRRGGGVGGSGGGAASVGWTKYAGSRVGADIRTAMVGGDGQRGGGLCAARSGDGVGVWYRIGDSGSMPNDSHWLATMDGAVVGTGHRRGAGT